jgi:ABC-2 type transport system permease protein
MHKALAISKTVFAQYLVYRLSFILWRVRVITTLFLTFFLWSAAYQNKLQVFHYSRAQINTYILLVYLIGMIAYSSRLGDLASQIRNGAIINKLLKPFPFLRFSFVSELVDKVLNLCFGILEILLLLWFFKPEIFWQTDLVALVFSVLAVVLGAIISFFILFSLSLIAFWSTEIWAPRFIFFVLISVASGTYFPLDILPQFFYRLLLLSPFPYFTYLPTKIYLEGISLEHMLLLGLAFLWVIISYFFARFLWRKGMREFSFFGR